MILCIDSGNTRLKWAVAEGGCWRARGAVAREETPRLAEAFGEFPTFRHILVANVAGAQQAIAIEAALRRFAVVPRFLAASANAGGVANGYRQPEKLGIDRWCALIGARHLSAGAALVVGSGTATTIDTLDAQGRFLGGLILPGFDLMRRALADHTAQLPLAEGRWQAHPDNTADAIVSGCLEAQLGAIERAWGRIAEEPGACCLLFGGNALRLAEHLACPFRMEENLVLEGLRRLALA